MEEKEFYFTWRFLINRQGLLGHKQHCLEAYQFEIQLFRYSQTWPQMVTLLDAYMSTIQYNVVTWSNPPQGWWKCITYGASRGNPGPSADST